ITTTYNIWNINEDEFEKISGAIGGQNQDLPETTEITLPKAQLGLARKFIIRYDYSILASANLNMRFAQTNDIFSTKAVSIDPALGIEGGFLDMVFVRLGAGNFQNVKRSEEHTSELQSRENLVCRLLLEKKKQQQQ